MAKGSEQVSIRDIAEAAGVSASTVSRALKNHPRISKKTCEKIQKLAIEMGYRHNALVSTLMTQLKFHRKMTYEPVLAWVTYHSPEDQVAIERLKVIFQGAKERAVLRGYRLEVFSVNEKEMRVSRLKSVLSNRGIQGVLFSPFGVENHEAWDEEWDDYACVVYGSVPARLPFYRAEGHGYYNMSMCFNNLRKLGYERIGFVTSKWRHVNNKGVPVARYLLHEYGEGGQGEGGMLMLEGDGEKGEGNFRKWVKQYRPEVIICSHPGPFHWLSEMGVKVPEEVGLVHISVDARNAKKWTGINQRQDLIGGAGVDLLVGQVERNERGLPDVDQVLSVRGAWVEGETTVAR